jgi:class 3 adenylate cyclase
VNLSQRLQDLARPGGTTVIADATVAALTSPPELEALPPQQVKGRNAPVCAFRVIVPAIESNHHEDQLKEMS